MYSQSGTIFRVVKDAAFQDNLKPGIYNLGLDRSGFYLDKTADKFDFSYEPEVVDENFINNVIKVWNSTTRNLGMLLSGLKGTGKTVTAKILCNSLNIPVICIGSSFGSEDDGGDALSSFLQSIETECIVFIDEYEKLFSQENLTALKILDSAYSQSAKKMFILTSNKATINENMIGRPSRLRYIKEFGNLSQQQILKLVNKFLNEDNINEKHAIVPEVVNMISGASCSTVDLVKSICNEINILGWDYDWFKNNFNLDLAYYQIYGYHICITDSCVHLADVKLFEPALKDFVATVPNIVLQLVELYDNNPVNWVNNIIICVYLLTNIDKINNQQLKDLFINYVNKQIIDRIIPQIDNILSGNRSTYGNRVVGNGNLWKLVESYLSSKLPNDYEDYIMNHVIDHNTANIIAKSLNEANIILENNREFFIFIFGMVIHEMFNFTNDNMTSSAVLIDSDYMGGQLLYTPVSSLDDLTQLNNIQLFTPSKDGNNKIKLRDSRSFSNYSDTIGQYEECLYDKTSGTKSGVILLNHDVYQNKLSLTLISKLKKETKYTF